MMAASVPPLVSAPALSQKQRRALLKKERRKRKRQALALARECGLKDGAHHTLEEEDDDDDDENAVEERQRLHEEWLERERLAQKEFNLKVEREETARKRKEEEEWRIKEEWEAQQRREQEEKEQKQQEKRDREEAVQKMLDQAESQLDNGGPWMNPEAPVKENYGTERDIANCPFFLKTGACRFGDRCSRKHVHPASSPTLMIRGMFVTYGMEQCRRDDYDTDACLEHSEEELQEYFLDFYHDVLPEFKSIGKVVQFKISCNFEPHLRGNVYIQFDTEEQCREAFIKFNGRWYAGRQLHCELCPVTRWKNAICGLFDRQKCPKGKHCNFLHVFRNPGNEFWEADRDLHMSPDRGGRGNHAGGWYSERCSERSWRQRNNSRSPPRSERSHSRRERERRRSRSRSRERRASHHQSDRSSRSRPVTRRKDRYRSRSRERDRDRLRNSREKDREHDKYRSRSRETDRPRSRSRDTDRPRSRSRETDRPRSRSRDKHGETHLSVERDRSRERSRDREREKQSRASNSNLSPKKLDRKDKTPDDTHTPRRQKHSKKSKKKNKKKHKKKKSHLPEGVTSSGESEKEEELEVGEKNLCTSPRKEIEEAELIQSAGEDLNPSVHNETESKCSLEVQHENCHPEIPSELVGNGDNSS